MKRISVCFIAIIMALSLVTCASAVPEIPARDISIGNGYATDEYAEGPCAVITSVQDNKDGSVTLSFDANGSTGSYSVEAYCIGKDKDPGSVITYSTLSYISFDDLPVSEAERTMMIAPGYYTVFVVSSWNYSTAGSESKYGVWISEPYYLPETDGKAFLKLNDVDLRYWGDIDDYNDHQSPEEILQLDNLTAEKLNRLHQRIAESRTTLFFYAAWELTNDEMIRKVQNGTRYRTSEEGKDQFFMVITGPGICLAHGSMFYIPVIETLRGEDDDLDYFFDQFGNDMGYGGEDPNMHAYLKKNNRYNLYESMTFDGFRPGEYEIAFFQRGTCIYRKSFTLR